MHTTCGVVAVVLISGFLGCLADPDDGTGEALQEASSESNATHEEIAAKCANNPKKVAICHIPPGNPANMHTICISQNAVDTHNQHHGDHIGPCQPTDGDGGDDSSGQGGASSTSGAGGATSTGSSTTTSTGSGAGGALTPEGGCSPEYPACSDHDDCIVGASCLFGCCVPFTT